MRISDWSSDVCSSDLAPVEGAGCRRCRGAPTPLSPPISVRRAISPPPARTGRAATASGDPALHHSCHSLGVRYHAGVNKLAGRPDSGKEAQCGARRPMPSAPCWKRRSEEHTSELQSLMRLTDDSFCLKKKKREKEQRKHKNE